MSLSIHQWTGGSAIRLMGAKDEEYGGDTNSVPNGPELKNRVGVLGSSHYLRFCKAGECGS